MVALIGRLSTGRMVAAFPSHVGRERAGSFPAGRFHLGDTAMSSKHRCARGLKRPRKAASVRVAGRTLTIATRDERGRWERERIALTAPVGEASEWAEWETVRSAGGSCVTVVVWGQRALRRFLDGAESLLGRAVKALADSPAGNEGWSIPWTEPLSSFLSDRKGLKRRHDPPQLEGDACGRDDGTGAAYWDRDPRGGTMYMVPLRFTVGRPLPGYWWHAFCAAVEDECAGAVVETVHGAGGSNSGGHMRWWQSDGKSAAFLPRGRAAAGAREALAERDRLAGRVRTARAVAADCKRYLADPGQEPTTRPQTKQLRDAFEKIASAAEVRLAAMDAALTGEHGPPMDVSEGGGRPAKRKTSAQASRADQRAGYDAARGAGEMERYHSVRDADSPEAIRRRVEMTLRAAEQAE